MLSIHRSPAVDEAASERVEASSATGSSRGGGTSGTENALSNGNFGFFSSAVDQGSFSRIGCAVGLDVVRLTNSFMSKILALVGLT
jgi:hypothetical protein